VAQIDSGAVRAVFIASHALRFVDPRGSFGYVKGWNSSLQSDELGALKPTFWGEADPDPERSVTNRILYITGL
jgi:hypothetical protein